MHSLGTRSAVEFLKVFTTNEQTLKSWTASVVMSCASGLSCVGLHRYHCSQTGSRQCIVKTVITLHMALVWKWLVCSVDQKQHSKTQRAHIRAQQFNVLKKWEMKKGPPKAEQRRGSEQRPSRGLWRFRLATSKFPKTPPRRMVKSPDKSEVDDEKDQNIVCICLTRRKVESPDKRGSSHCLHWSDSSPLWDFDRKRWKPWQRRGYRHSAWCCWKARLEGSHLPKLLSQRTRRGTWERRETKVQPKN